MTELQKQRFAEALSRISGDEATLEMLAAIAAEDAPVLLDRLQSNLENEDCGEYAKTAHALKGLLSTFETSAPVSDIQPAIDAARKRDVVEVKNIHHSMSPAVQSLIAEITALAR